MNGEGSVSLQHASSGSNSCSFDASGSGIGSMQGNDISAIEGSFQVCNGEEGNVAEVGSAAGASVDADEAAVGMAEEVEMSYAGNRSAMSGRSASNASDILNESVAALYNEAMDTTCGNLSQADQKQQHLQQQAALVQKLQALNADSRSNTLLQCGVPSIPNSRDRAYVYRYEASLCWICCLDCRDKGWPYYCSYRSRCSSNCYSCSGGGLC